MMDILQWTQEQCLDLCPLFARGSYAPDRMFSRWPNRHLLGMVGVSLVYIVSYASIREYLYPND